MNDDVVYYNNNSNNNNKETTECQCQCRFISRINTKPLMRCVR